jgi:ABC-2 type transport system ATP-binding protein
MPEERGLYKKMKLVSRLYTWPVARLERRSYATNTRLVYKVRDAKLVEQKVEDLSKGMSQKLQFVTTVLHQPKTYYS